mmetsp:Transcript_13406/g.21981  ORF Transcript_13406/g.21981 Transcript_13406/m.21981 type:complete len:170 (+) Transcript_13406:52-561(+)
MTAIRHPYSKSLKEEITAVLTKTEKQKKKSTHYPMKLMEQGKAYEELSRVESGLSYVNLFDGSFLVHQLQSNSGKLFRCKWYRQYQEWADRDQVAGSFVVNKMMYDYNQKFGKKEAVKKEEWMPIVGEKRDSDGRVELEKSYVHIINGKFHPWRSTKIIQKLKFPYAYK